MTSLPSPAQRTRRRWPRGGRGWGDAPTAAAFLLPNLLGFLAFTLLPVLAVFGMSLVRWGLVDRPVYVGFSNFGQLLGMGYRGGRLVAHDPDFWRFLWNTLYLMGGIPIGIAISLLLALLLNQRLRGIVVFRTLFFLPTVCSAVAVALLWKWILEPEYGLLNFALMKLGAAHPPLWLASTHWAKPAFILMTLWATVGGYNCVLYLAGLQNVPAELYEAAEMDGANAWHKLRHVTWPLLSPTTFFIVTISIIAGFQGGFVAAFMMTDGGPAGATTTIMYYIYKQAFWWSQVGYGAAIAVVLFALVFGLTLLNWRLGKRVVFYE